MILYSPTAKLIFIHATPLSLVVPVYVLPFILKVTSAFAKTEVPFQKVALYLEVSPQYLIKSLPIIDDKTFTFFESDEAEY